jgi:hypothetical protein
VDGVGEADNTVELVSLVTDAVNVFEVLAPFLESPPYEAVSVWLPAASDEVVKVAVPPLKVTLPSVVEPSWKVTVPVAEAGLTVEVRVTGCPKVEDVGVTEREVVVVERPTDSVTEFDVLAA